MRSEHVLQSLTGSISGARAKDHVSKIAEFHRIQGSPGYDDAVDAVQDALGRFGVEASVSSFPADGRTETHGWAAPIGWQIRSGWLREHAPQRHALCSYAESPISILGQSGPGRAEAELVHIGEGTAAKDVNGKDLAGRFVLACGRATEVLERIRGRGVAGLIIYPTTERAAASYDLVQYAGLFPHADALETTPMGFSVSRRVADRLLRELNEGPVRLAGEVDADYFHGALKVVEAEIAAGARRGGEVLLVAHLCHPRPSANDNASGAGLLIEIARALAEVGRQAGWENAVRLLWVPEFHGTIPWAAANAARLQDVCYVLNLDMVGQSPERIGEPLRVFRAPSARPTYLNACLAPILTRIAADEGARSPRGSRRPLHWIVDAPSGGSDHLVFQAAPYGLAAVMLGHDDPFWHTDLDTTDNVDPTRLKQVGLLAATLATLPTWAPSEAARLAGWLLSYSGWEIARAAQLARAEGASFGRGLIDVALRIERARAEALDRLVGRASWDLEAHRAALDSIARAVRGSLPRGEGPCGARPRRIVDGPVRFAIAERFTAEERAFFEETLGAHHRAAVESLVNLCDGTRAVSEIASCMTLDCDRLFSVDDTARSVELLAKAGYVAV